MTPIFDGHPDRQVADLWLRRGMKYRFSALWYWQSWYRPIGKVLRDAGIDLGNAVTLRAVVDRFKDRIRWRPDPLFQAADLVLPPERLLRAGGDDCDGSAMLWAQAVNFAVPDGLARILSYLADPWRMSHHVCLVTLPDGALVAIQPPPAETQDPDQDPIVTDANGEPRRFKAYEQAAREIASWYGATIQGYDIRDDMWRVREPWRWLS